MNIFRLIILISCLIGVALCGCNRGGEGGNGCGRKNGGRHGGCGGLSGHSSSSNDYRDYDYDIIPLPDEVGTVGILDSPFYDCKSKSLYFVDLFKQNLYRYSEETNQIYYCSIPDFVTPSFILPLRGQRDMFAVGQNQSVHLVQWDGVSTRCTYVKRVVTAEQDPTHHTNDAVAGPKGGLYFGYFNQKLCGGPADQGLYRWTKKYGLERLPGSYKTSNSMAYDYKRNKLYVMDGCDQTVRAFKINPKTGKIHGPWVVFNSFNAPNSVAPVGLSIDENGNLVVGEYRGGRLHFIDPCNGKLLKTVNMPIKFTSSNTYGGCQREKLYVLTAELDADIITGTPLNTTVPSPGGSLLVFYGLGRGQHQLRKPCIGC